MTDLEKLKDAITVIDDEDEKPMAELSTEQKRCFDAAMSGQNLFVSGPGGVGKCGTIEERVVLEGGRIASFGELLNSTFKILSYGVNGKQETTEGYASPNGLQKVWKITTKTGREITRTGNHPLLATRFITSKSDKARPMYSEWVPLADLNNEYAVLIPEVLMVEGNKSKDINHVKFLGYMLGDGDITNQVIFTQEEGRIKEEFKKVVEALGCKIVVKQKFSLGVVGENESRNHALALLREWNVFGKKSIDKYFPAWVWELPNNQLAVLLNRLFSCDGYAYAGTYKTQNKRPAGANIGIGLSSEKMIRDVELALLRFGVCSHVRKKIVKLNGKEFPTWVLTIGGIASIRRFAKEIGIFGKEEALEKVLEKTKDKVPATGWLYAGVPVGYRWDRVKKIEQLGEEETVSITVPKNETFITTFVEHNSFVIKHIMEEFSSRQHKFRIAASTGVAALNVGGSTIHALLGTRIAGTIKEAKEYHGTHVMQKAQNRLNFVQTLIVDEVSMLSGDYITMMDWWLQQVRSNYEPFGGLQIIFCGDFCQLSPVEKGHTPEYRFAVDSPSWERAKLQTIDLQRSFRQSDQTFVNALNRVRFGEYTKEIRKIFRPCIGRELVEPTHLVSTNKEADQINFDKLRSHQGEEFQAKPTFQFFTRYPKGVPEKMVRNSLTDSPLTLKIGVPVLLLKNHKEGLYVNGSRGIVKNINTDEDSEIIGILVTLDSGEDVIVKKEEWEQVDGDQRVTAIMTHFPVRLGWALTIHRSQGLTLDNVEIDLSNGFACGQAYVALSRMRSLEGLSLTVPIDPSIVRAEPRLVEFYDKARVKSF